MDQFLLDNTALYGALVEQFKPAPRPARKPDATTAGLPSMAVSVRIRPFLDQDIAAGFPCAAFIRPEKAGVLDIHDLYHHPKGRPVLKSYCYQVDTVFGPDTTEQEIYDSHVESLLTFASGGACATLFAYGQTGSGKTTTISGIERLVGASLFGDVATEQGNNIYMTFIELAGNQAYDLLSSRNPISLRDDETGTTQLGAEEHAVHDQAEMTNLIEEATRFRRTEATQKNDTSSRSHAICRIRIDTSHSATSGYLYLVDLAGSEAARDIAIHGADRMRETREINVSLSVLKDCIRGRAQYDTSASKAKTPPYLPFRQSALTRVLKHAFDPAADSEEVKTLVIACVNPGLADVGATRNTLRYAEMLCGSTPSAVITTVASSRVVAKVNKKT